MPIFFFISGYWSKGLYARPIGESILKRVKQLLIPCILFSLLWELIVQVNVAIMDEPISLLSFAKRVVNGYWFIYCLLYCVIIVCLSKTIFRRHKYLGLFFFLVVLLLLPDYLEIGTQKINLHIKYLKSMYPFYAIGIVAYDFKDRIVKHSKAITWVSLFVFVFCLVIWKREYYMYCSSMDIYQENIMNIAVRYAMRLIAGLSGIVICFSLCKWAYDRKLMMPLTELGVMSLGVYLVQGIIFNVFIINIPATIDNIFVYNAICIVLALILTLLCAIIIRCLNKYKIPRRYFLGKY